MSRCGSVQSSSANMDAVIAKSRSRKGSVKFICPADRRSEKFTLPRHIRHNRRAGNGKDYNNQHADNNSAWRPAD